MNRMIRIDKGETWDRLKHSKEVANLIGKYKSLNIIRRDLRAVHSHLKTAIKFQEQIADLAQAQGASKAGEDTSWVSQLGMATDLFHFSIVVYARWFKQTRGKTKLDPKKYFATAELRDAHDWAIRMRDEFIAHNEVDVFTDDIVECEVDDNGGPIKLISCWKGKPWPNNKQVPLVAFMRCVEAVHDRIDSVEIPAAEAKLLAKLSELELIGAQNP